MLVLFTSSLDRQSLLDDVAAGVFELHRFGFVDASLAEGCCVCATALTLRNLLDQHQRRLLAEVERF